jgi:NTP pyrophosphatase (non-canonical NTP hydrolase)
MGYGTNGLSFNTLREANTARLPEFKNNKGEPAHSKPDGSDWSLNDWMTACLGELGEAANVCKKIRRGDMTLEEARPLLIQEFADVVTYLDILAGQAGINLGMAVTDTFNKKSTQVGSSIHIEGDEWRRRINR